MNCWMIGAMSRYVYVVSSVLSYEETQPFLVTFDEEEALSYPEAEVYRMLLGEVAQNPDMWVGGMWVR